MRVDKTDVLQPSTVKLTAVNFRPSLTDFLYLALGRGSRWGRLEGR